MIYSPLEDSFLLEEQAKLFAKGSVLDMGTGTGIQAVAAARKRNVREVIAVDMQKDVIEFCLRNVKYKKIKFFVSDLFEFFKKNKKYKNKKFDTIIFNPPYLPAEPKLKDLTFEGGKRGFETAKRFLDKAVDYLKDDGIILLLISSLTNRPKVEEILTKNLFEFRITAKKHIFFEDLLVYLIQKNKVILKLKKKKIKDIQYFAKGHRGILFTGKYKNRKITIKAKLPESKAVGRIANEAKWIKRLNKKGIGPRLALSDKDFFAYYFVEGIFLPEFVETSSKQKIKQVIKDVLNQCHVMDMMGIDKEEMHRPFKHIIVKKNKAALIDFERTHESKKPKNVTQFIQYLTSSRLAAVLKKKGFRISRKKMIKASRNYKKNLSKQSLEQLIHLVGLHN